MMDTDKMVNKHFMSRHLKEYKTMKQGCPACRSVYIWHDKYGWTMDADDGLRGFPILFCPYCGTKLIHEEEKEG